MAIPKAPTTVYWLGSSLYLNITNSCSNDCYFCFKRYKRGIGDFNLKLVAEPSIEQIKAELAVVLRRHSWKEVVFCGFGEPTARLDVLLELARWLRSQIGSSLPIRINTNGHAHLLNPKRDVVAELKAAGVNKVAVSLNAADQQSYAGICKPKMLNAYQAALDFIYAAKGILEVEISAVRLPEVDLPALQKVADGYGVSFRVRDYIQCFY